MNDTSTSIEPANEAATEALANAMYRYTFGIISDGKGHAEGRGLGTGIGIVWNGVHLILTAAHIMETTPSDRLYMLLPSESVEFQRSGIRTQPKPFAIRRRVALENPTPLLADDGEDLAAFILPKQKDDCGQLHFYNLDESHSTHDVVNQQIGIMGYPAATSMQVGDGFMATPYVSFGSLSSLTLEGNLEFQMAISYPTTNSVDPHGLSGCGLWAANQISTGALWTPGISLAGLVTHWDARNQVLIGFTARVLLRFLESKQSWLSS